MQERTIDAVTRKACSGEECNFVHWDNPTPVVMALVQLDDHFIIARNVQWPEGMFSVIAGFLERGETPDQGDCVKWKRSLACGAKKPFSP